MECPSHQSLSVNPMTLGDSVLAEGLSLLYIAFIAAAAVFTGLFYVLFPELGALAHDVMRRPLGKWSSQPLRLIVTPVLTAVAGTLVTRQLPYHVLTILLLTVSSLLIIFLLHSAIAPAISAGVLPLVLHVTSWLYPLSILGGLVLLVALLLGWRKYLGVWRLHPTSGVQSDIDDVIESLPRANHWLIPLLLFVTVTGLAAQLTGLRFILFPPLIVMAYEMFGHPDTCPCTKRPLSLPIVCFLTALGGLLATTTLGVGPLAAGCSMGWSIIVLRLFDVHMPPALAVGLLPLVMDSPSMRYPLSVAVGTATLTGWFLLWRKVLPAGQSDNRHGSVEDVSDGKRVSS
jgi:HPP family